MQDSAGSEMAAQPSMATQDACALQLAGKNRTAAAHEAEKATTAERPQLPGGIKCVSWQSG